MSFIIGILLVAMATLLLLPDPTPTPTPPESDAVRQLRYKLMAESLVYIYELRIAGGQWEALTDRGWILSRDLLDGVAYEDFGR